MKWKEFSSLLGGIGENTALGRLVQIRLENDKNMLKNFTPAQLRIRSEWRNKQVKKVSQIDSENALEQFKMMFIRMAGESNGE